MPPLRVPGPEGFLSDASMARRVHAESVLLLGGGRALLMQIAHPLVARGVAEHSSFSRDRWGRLLRTLRPPLALLFGSRSQALSAAGGVNRLHAGVNGHGYAALDPDLLLWVWATLVDTSLLTHRLLVRPLSESETDAYYADLRSLGRLCGIPEAAFPPDARALAAYVEGMTEDLVVSDEGRRIARELLRPAWPLGPCLAPVRWLTAGLLDERLRDQFELAWGPRQEAALRALCGASRALLPLTPAQLRRPPWFLMPERVTSNQ